MQFSLTKSCHNQPVADLGGREGRAPPPWEPKFFRFHAVFRKFWQNRMLAPPLGSWRPPRGNPGSAAASLSEKSWSVTDYFLISALHWNGWRKTKLWTFCHSSGSGWGREDKQAVHPWLVKISYKKDPLPCSFASFRIRNCFTVFFSFLCYFLYLEKMVINIGFQSTT